MYYQDRIKMNNLILAYIISLAGVLGMFFFPNPEENFLMYIGLVLIVSIITIILLRFDEKKRKIKKSRAFLGLFGILGVIIYHNLL